MERESFNEVTGLLISVGFRAFQIHCCWCCHGGGYEVLTGLLDNLPHLGELSGSQPLYSSLSLEWAGRVEGCEMLRV